MSATENPNTRRPLLVELRALLSTHARVLRRAEGTPSAEAALIGNRLLDSVPGLLDEIEALRRKLTSITGFLHGDDPMVGPCILGCAGSHYDVHADDCHFIGTGPCPSFERGKDGQCVLPKYHSRPHRRADGTEWGQ